MSITSTGHDEVTRAQLQTAIEEIVDAGFLGVVLRVRDEHGQWVGSAGSSRLGEPGEPPVDGHFRIGSNTKTFTAALVLLLVAEGRIELDAPVAAYLPEYALDERITVRMLLQHTSGVFNFTGEFFPDGTYQPGIAAPGTPLGDAWVDDRFRTYRPQELAELALSKPVRFEPGTGWSYSNTNYVLARLVIEKVTGRTLPEEMQRLITGPLGLVGTVLPEASPEIPEPHAHAYYRHEGPDGTHVVDVAHHNPSWVSTGGDMISTTADLATFISALLDGRLLPAPLLAEMCRPHPTGIPGMDYGLGVFVEKVGSGGTVITHNGGLAGYAALMYSTPDGSKTMTASLTCVDDSKLTIAPVFVDARQRLVELVFGSGQAQPAG
ncbi:serine hydrolase domain-containing protein [Catellatospora bangladeshensis]|uniref:Serine hydrolase n=2 Tax=Catellatospora bangladeshensis TaxID=310355 RepID=A0A8J3JVN7_9ACTN|nr:serine hydrolase domain-containing protein [Catellatospora bangladeshensis]GIF84559.1 serine hydrolase [Catellatospora bangladeshensis]